MPDSLWHASALDAQTAVLWPSTPSGAVLVVDEAGHPYAAPDVNTLVAHAPDPAVAVALTLSTAIFTSPKRQRTFPQISRRHVPKTPTHISPNQHQGNPGNERRRPGQRPPGSGGPRAGWSGRAVTSDGRSGRGGRPDRATGRGWADGEPEARPGARPRAGVGGGS